MLDQEDIKIIEKTVREQSSRVIVEALNELIIPQFLQIDGRFDKVDKRFEALEVRMTNIEHEVTNMDERLGNVEATTDKTLRTFEKHDDRFDSQAEKANDHERRLVRLEAVGGLP